jgi:hypothetical protein
VTRSMLQKTLGWCVVACACVCRCMHGVDVCTVLCVYRPDMRIDKVLQPFIREGECLFVCVCGVLGCM